MTFKYQIGQKLRVVNPGGTYSDEMRRLTRKFGDPTGAIGIVQDRRPNIGKNWYKLEGVGLWIVEGVLVPVNDKPETSTWDEFRRVTGCDPSKEPVYINRS